MLVCCDCCARVCLSLDVWFYFTCWGNPELKPTHLLTRQLETEADSARGGGGNRAARARACGERGSRLAVARGAPPNYPHRTGELSLVWIVSHKAVGL